MQPMVKLFLEMLADEMLQGPGRHRLLVALDEFLQLGHMPAVEKFVATGRECGMVAMMVCQSVAQLRGVYGPAAEGIRANSVNVFAAATGEDAQAISGYLGKYTAEVDGKRAPRELRAANEVAEMRELQVSGRGRVKQSGQLVIIRRSCPPIDAVTGFWGDDREVRGRAYLPVGDSARAGAYAWPGEVGHG